MRKIFYVGLLFVLSFLVLNAGQSTHPVHDVDSGSGAPTGTCGHNLYVDNVAGKLYFCQSGSWVVANGSASALPTGSIVFVDSGTCPTGFTQDAAFNGAYVLGTIAANGNVGTTGGSLAYTPAGTNSSPTFTGSAGTVPAETFTGSSATTSAVSAGTPAGTNSAPTFTGTAQTWTLQGKATGTATDVVGPNPYTPAGTVSAPTFTGSALATHTHTVTATGTNGTASFTPAGSVSAPSFSGTPATIQPTFLKVIACKAN